MKMISLIVMLSLMATSPPDGAPLDSLTGLLRSLNTPTLPHIERVVADVEEEIFADESGEVPILLYHRIKESQEAYDSAPETFRKNLKTLYDAGFVLVDLMDYLAGVVDIPAGKHPVVITFDDGDRTQFNFLTDSDGQPLIDPDCAVGILYSFYLQHPEFGFEATFFLNGQVPFGQAEWAETKLDFIRRHGLTLGNHTIGHQNLSELASSEAVQAVVMDNETYFKTHYGVDLSPLLAVPFGVYPTELSSLEAVGYPAFKVGWRPERSVFDRAFDPLRINRVQNGEAPYQFDHWVEVWARDPDRLFTSDGDPGRITVPEDRVEILDPTWLDTLELVISEVK